MNTPSLAEPSRRLLLELARQSLVAAVSRRPLPELPAGLPEALLAPERGAFVTLTRDHRLRGCIGLLESHLPLVHTVIRMAAAAAVKDSRFRPVTLAEAADLRIEISVLSSLCRVASADEIVMGRDGVLLECDGRSGVFLPQVALETGWDRERFLAELCSGKAGLPEDAWQRPDARLYTFTAEIFHE